MNNLIKESKTTKKLPLYYDVVFKSLFAKEENKQLLISLLEAILSIKIKNLEVKNPEIPRDLIDSKAGVLDIKATVDDNIILDIEMQTTDEGNFKERSPFYLMILGSEALHKGEDYSKFKKAIVINILNFNSFKTNTYLNTAHMKFDPIKKEYFVDMGYDKQEEFATDKLEMIFLELPKFLKKNPKHYDLLSQWLMLILGKEEELKMSKNVDARILEAIQKIDVMNMTPEEWELYDSKRKAIFNYNTGMRNAQLRGEEIGEKRGEKRGLESGKKIGENKKKIEIAKKMLELNMTIDIISKVTGLSVEEIRNLK